MSKRIFKDALDILCSDEEIGSGYSRDVFDCRLDSKLVVKVERDDKHYRSFNNVMECTFWNDNQYNPKIAKWLAPCEYLSPDGFILIQQKAAPIPDDYKLPDKLPSFFTDIKRENFGLLNGRLVCIDYAAHIENPSLRLKKVEWS
jgi:hypothetical protein